MFIQYYIVQGVNVTESMYVLNSFSLFSLCLHYKTALKLPRRTFNSQKRRQTKAQGQILPRILYTHFLLQPTSVSWDAWVFPKYPVTYKSNILEVGPLGCNPYIWKIYTT